VFFLKSIRRRLVTGFTVAFVLLLLMASAAIWGLNRHQHAVSTIHHLVHHSPDKAQLESAINRIILPFTPSKSDVAEAMQRDFLSRIVTARKEADTYYRRSEEAARDPSQFVPGRGGTYPLLTRYMDKVYEGLGNLDALASEFQFAPGTDEKTRTTHIAAIKQAAMEQVAVLHENLNRLPDYDKQKHVAASLIGEQRQSTRMLKNVRIIIIVAVIAYGITIFFGFRWVSNPLRAIASGASRIANGDTDYRLEPVSHWKDEFFDLTENFNRMADRFHESEDHLSAKVEERSRQLVRSERLAGVGFLAAGVAHEINNPLQAMSMAAESVQFRLHEHLPPDNADTKEVMERLDMIQRESKRCGQITRRLLDFARNERQEKLPDDLTRVIGEVLAMIRPMSKYQDREIIFDRSAPLIMEINASQMKQVMLNLIANALQATDSGGRVEVHIEEHTDWVVVAVKDNGHGMKPENVDNLFEPFYTTKETGEGTGLGLSITHRIVVDHSGTIDPHSDGPGKGSTFRLRLPRRQPQQKAA